MSYKISLKAARVNANMTQEEVAKKMEISKNLVIAWENGTRKLKPAEFMFLCNLYKVPEEMVKID